MDLNSLSSYSSIISLIISVFTFVLLFSIRKKFLFRTTLDKNTNNLKKISSEINSLLIDYDSNIDELDEKIRLIDVKFRFIQKGATGDLLKDVKDGRDKIKKYYKTSFFKKDFPFKNKKFAREIKTSISIIIEELSNVKQELKVGN